MHPLNSLIHFILLTFTLTSTSQTKNSYENDYNTVTINNKTWMAENLNSSNFRNGDIIPEVKNIDQWNKIKSPAWCYYEYNTPQGKKFGKLYNWYAVNDPRGLAPEGWHIPSESEFQSLSDFLGGALISGELLKNTVGWKSYSGIEANGNNKSGFTALPAGNISIMGFANKDYATGFWSSSLQKEFNQPIYFGLFGDGKTFMKNYSDYETGFSIRCIKD